MIRHSLAALFAMSACLSSQAAAPPKISPTLQKMLGALPINEVKDDVQKAVGTLRQTQCGGGLAGCYMAKSGNLQLYFFTSNSAQQTFLLVINQTLALPKLLKANVQAALGGTQVKDPIISISTTDYVLDVTKMPADLQAVVRDSYFGVDSMEFAEGVQFAARANLGGGLRAVMAMQGVNADQLSMRGGVIMPVPTDLAAGAGAGAGLAQSISESDTMKKSVADALKPGAFVEFQLGPGAVVNSFAPVARLTDATYFIDNELIFGYKGNAQFGLSTKTFVMQFQTPLTPAGAMDLADFSFRMATPATINLQDFAFMAIGMAVPETTVLQSQAASAALKKMGGGFIGGIGAIKSALNTTSKALSVFQVTNPVPPAPFKFGDRSKPFPTDDKFNLFVYGPLADGGPAAHIAADVRILGQTMGKIDVTVGPQGFHGTAEENISLKLGPLGSTRIRMLAKADITAKTQDVSLTGNLSGQKLTITLSGSKMDAYFSASCANPFEIRVSASIEESMDIAKIFDGAAAVNVDPSKLEKCVGKELEAAYNKIANEYKSLQGFSASQANAALKKINDDYNKAKDTARKAADAAQHAAANAFRDAGNAFKKLGGKKHKHKDPPDPRFSPSVFDWDYYYDNNPDVVSKGADLYDHWKNNGIREGRQGAPEFHAKYYRDRYIDVQQLCKASDEVCTITHWVNNGVEGGRQGSPTHAVADYLKRYPDLQKSLGKQNYEEAMNHWLNDGEDLKRDPSPAAVTSGPIYGPLVIGGDGGDLWTDIDACTKGGAVTGFSIASGDEVEAISFKYGSVEGGRYGSVNMYNIKGQLNKFEEAHTFASGEYITEIAYRSGARVDQISFTTNKGKTYGPYGGGGGTAGKIKLPADVRLVCMAGRAGATIDKLIFTWSGPR
jgi:hypothetical protein